MANIYLNHHILKDAVMEIEIHTIEVKLSKVFQFRLWLAIQLIKLAAFVSGMGIKIKK